MNKWLLKTEPSTYSYDDLERDGKTVWDGVRNSLALKHMRDVRKGDRAIIYHTGSERRAVGIAKIVSDAYPDPKGNTDKAVVFEIAPDARLSQAVTLDELKNDPAFEGFDLIRLPRLSVMPVPPKLWTRLVGDKS